VPVGSMTRQRDCAIAPDPQASQSDIVASKNSRMRSPVDLAPGCPDARGLRPSLEPSLRHPAGYRIGRIEYVRHIVTYDLPEQMASADRIEAVIRPEPSEHLGRGVLQRLIERASVADREDFVRRLAARPADRLALQYADGEFDLERGNQAVVPGPKRR
jgi:hypothetical protein